MLIWLALFLAGGLGSLAAARYLSGPGWVDALLASFVCAAAAVGVGIGLLVRRLTRTWKAPVAFSLGLCAAVGRFSLLAWITVEPRRIVRIAIPELPIAMGTIAWGLLALLWGASALAEALEDVDQGSRSRRRVVVAASGMAVALGLYVLAPLGLLLGLRVNHWTVLGLFALAAVAYGAGRLYALITAARRPRP